WPKRAFDRARKAAGLKGGKDEALSSGWVRTYRTNDGREVNVEFDGGNPDAVRNAAAYVRDAFRGGAEVAVVSRSVGAAGIGGDRDEGVFDSEGAAMRFVRHGTKKSARPEGDGRFRAEEATENPDSRKPRKFPDVGEEMGWNDSYLSKSASGPRTVAVDFDGTMTSTEGGEPNPRTLAVVRALLRDGVPVVVFSARPAAEIEPRLAEWGLPGLEVTNVKRPDFRVMLDDRAVQFQPDDGRTPGQEAADLASFRAWWEKREFVAVFRAAAFDESEHPRDEGGKFSESGGADRPRPEGGDHPDVPGGD
ncbi:MAG: hypothetical protein AAB368_07220, partial [bacterium]